MTVLRRLLVALACAMSVSSASAEVNRGDGSQTGDGSTPFTGLAQAPEANLFVGASTTSIPIEVSPGRKNLTPKLALVYNSNGGPSPYGYGWDLPLGKIQPRWGSSLDKGLYTAVRLTKSAHWCRQPQSPLRGHGRLLQRLLL